MARLTLVFVVAAAGGPSYGSNLVRQAAITQPPDSRGGPIAIDGAAARLTDTTNDAGLVWANRLDGLPAVLEMDIGRPVRLSVIVCRWRFAPSDYSIQTRINGHWRQVASVADNTIGTDKILLHTFGPVETGRVRFVITGTVSKSRQCGWRAVEIYEDGRLPSNVQALLDRPTPCQYVTRADTQTRERNAKRPLKRDLLDAPIPTWEPIPHRLYNNRPEGKRVNELAAQRRALLANCAHEYLQTGRREYAAKARDVLFAEIDHYDRYQAFRFVGRSWQAVTFQEPGYMLTGLFRAYDAIADTLSTTQRLRFLYFGLDLGDFQYRAIREFTPLPQKVTHRGHIANWVPNSFGALALAAAYLRDFPETENWMAECDRKFPGFFKDVFFLPDGTWWECSPAHHVYVQRGIAKYALAKHLLGEPIWNRRFGTLTVAETFEALAKTANPLGEFPSVNDSYGHGRPIRTAYTELIGPATVMGRGDFLYAWRAEPQLPAALADQPIDIEVGPPTYTSILMPHAGQAVFRDGWRPDDTYLFLDYGPHGGGHGHLDKLSFALFADGHHWVPDAACAPHYCIFPEQWQWHKQTISHNTVLVDGKSQAACTGRLVCWHTDAQADLVSAECTEGYVSQPLLELDLDGKARRLTLTPRENVPLRIAAVRLSPADGKPIVLGPSRFETQHCQGIDDTDAPEKRAAVMKTKAASVAVKLTAPAGRYRLSILGCGADMSHDSVYVALDGRRVGQSALGVKKHRWFDAIGPAKAVHHRRTCYHPRAGWFLFHDTLIAKDHGDHTLDWLLHVYGEFDGQQPGSLCFKHGRHRLLVVSPDIGEEPIKISKGLCGGLEREKWQGQGYPPKGGPGWIYIPYVALPKRLTPNAPEAHFWALLVPFRGDRPDASVAVLAASNGRHGVRVRVGDRTDELIESFDPFVFVVTSHRPGKQPSARRFTAARGRGSDGRPTKGAS